jgi:hypothetical protein
VYVCPRSWEWNIFKWRFVFFISLSLNFNVLASPPNDFGMYVWDGLLDGPRPIVSITDLMIKYGFDSIHYIFSPTSFINY